MKLTLDVLFNLPTNYSERRLVEWTKVTLKNKPINQQDIYDWLGANAKSKWNCRHTLEATTNFYFEDDKDSMLFVLRWS